MGSITQVLNATKNYPQFRSIVTKRKARNFWLDVDNQRNFLEESAPKLQIKSLDDWYNVSKQVSVT
jgi:hypothetical protein